MSQLIKNDHFKKIKNAGMYILIVPLAPAIIVLILLFLLGFTNLITNSSNLAKIFFVIIVIPTIIYTLAIRAIVRFLSKIKYRNEKNTMRKNSQESIVRDVEYTQT
jgi:hypothetical protein